MGERKSGREREGNKYKYSVRKRQKKKNRYVYKNKKWYFTILIVNQFVAQFGV